MTDSEIPDRPDLNHGDAAEQTPPDPRAQEDKATVPQENDTTLTFGNEFGAQLAALEGEVSAEEQEAIAALPSGSALLIVRRGPTAGARFLLDADVTTAEIGRAHV